MSVDYEFEESVESLESLDSVEDYSDVVSGIHAGPERKREAYDTCESVPENADFDNLTESDSSDDERQATPEESSQPLAPSQSDVLELLCDFWDAMKNGNCREAMKILSRTTFGTLALKERKRMKIEDSNGKFVLGDWSVLCLAVFRESIEIVQVLIEKYNLRVSVNTSVRVIHCESELFFNFHGPTDFTALDVACALGSEPLVDILLCHLEGIKSFTKPLCWCLANGHEAIAWKVARVAKAAYVYSLSQCFDYACCGGMKMVNLFIEIFGRPQLASESILWAVYGVHRKVVDFLVREFQLNFSTCRNVFKENAIHYLCCSHRKTEPERISLLKYLMRTGELSLDETDSSDNTPLASACLEKNFKLAKVLVDMGANLQLETSSLVQEAVLRDDCHVAPGMAKLRLTISKWPFISALYDHVQHRSCFDSFVLEKVIVPETTCSLHWACWQGTEKSLKVLLEGGANIEERDIERRTPVFYCSNLANLQFLVSKCSADIETIDNDGRSLLHACATNYFLDECTEMLKYLIAQGLSADEPVKNVCDVTDCRLPYEVADFEPRVFLHSEYVKKIHSHLDKEKVKPGWVQFSFVGRPGAGKTTLANSLRFESKFIEPDERTAGVEVHNAKVGGVGLSSLWDFGGQLSFRVAHAIFFNYSLSVFVLVVDLFHESGATKTKEEIYDEAVESLAFVKSARKIILMKSGKVTLITVGNKRTGDREEDDISISPCDELKWAIEDAIEAFRGVFESAAVVELDCKKPNSVSMTKLRDQMKKIRENCIENADLVPKVCEHVKFLIFTKLNQRPVATQLLNEKEFEALLTDCLQRPLPKEVSVARLAAYLHDTGAIVHFSDLQLVCLRPSVLVTNLIGPLLSAPNVFPISAVTATSGGKATKAQMQKALHRFKEKQESEGNIAATFAIDEAIRVMLDLGLCCKVQGKEDVYYVPSLIEESKPSAAWEKKSELSFYRGRRYRVVNETTDIVPPPVFSIFQSRCSDLSGYRLLLWKDALKLQSDGGTDITECLIEITGARKSIDVLVRCREGDERAAESMYAKVKQVVKDVHDERVPGTPMDWCYLSSEDLRDHKENVAVYKIKPAIESKRLNDRVLAEQSRGGSFPTCQVKDLLFPVTREGEESTRFPDDGNKVCNPLIKAVASVGRIEWESICCDLLDICDLEDIKRASNQSRVCLQKVLNLWVIRRGQRATVGRLLKACERSKISRSFIEKGYEDFVD
ncbi:death-associated protein kinase 1-like isoform X2 [Oscarella lobularis]|uniref:death-associated protein kinase 1-like isoform X2 n=1 Tax=Oscarella lobularis TaxID=121494 RepID=UPI003313285B